MHRPPPCSTLFPYTTLFRSVLIDAVAAHSKSAHHHAVLIERSAAGEEDDPILELTGRLMPVRTRVRDIVKKEVEEWSCRIGVDARRKKWLPSEADGSIRNGCSRRHTRHLLGINRRAGEIDHVPCLSDRHVGRKDLCVGHAIQGKQVTVKIGYGKDEAGGRAIRQANHGALVVGYCDRGVNDAA